MSRKNNFISIAKDTFGFFLTEHEIEIQICFCRFQVFLNHSIHQTVIAQKFKENALIPQQLLYLVISWSWGLDFPLSSNQHKVLTLANCFSHISSSYDISNEVYCRNRYIYLIYLRRLKWFWISFNTRQF